MDFKLVIGKLTEAFREHDVKYALIGGFAIGLWGAGRSTVNVDFLIRRDDAETVDRIMRDIGYECRYKSENVSQYTSPLNVLGEVDFLHAFREASVDMLERAESKEVFGGSLKIIVLKPEDIVGLKLQAAKNDPSRLQNEMQDIESLLSATDAAIDWHLIEKYADIGTGGFIGKYIQVEEKVTPLTPADKEIIELSNSESLRRDMRAVASQRHNPFIKNGKHDPDAYIEFVSRYNEFINHKPKPFRKMIDRIMPL